MAFTWMDVVHVFFESCNNILGFIGFIYAIGTLYYYFTSKKQRFSGVGFFIVYIFVTLITLILAYVLELVALGYVQATSLQLLILISFLAGAFFITRPFFLIPKKNL
jgi:hypothetical protein